MSLIESEIAYTELRVAMRTLGLRSKDLAEIQQRTRSIVAKWRTGAKPIPRYVCAFLIALNHEDDNRPDKSDFSGDGFSASFLFNWHEVLGLEPFATLEEAAAARNALLKIYHPDVGRSGMPSSSITARINAAYEEAKQDLKNRPANLQKVHPNIYRNPSPASMPNSRHAA